MLSPVFGSSAWAQSEAPVPAEAPAPIGEPQSSDDEGARAPGLRLERFVPPSTPLFVHFGGAPTGKPTPTASERILAEPRVKALLTKVMPQGDAVDSLVSSLKQSHTQLVGPQGGSMCLRLIGREKRSAYPDLAFALHGTSAQDLTRMKQVLEDLVRKAIATWTFDTSRLAGSEPTVEEDEASESAAHGPQPAIFELVPLGASRATAPAKFRIHMHEVGSTLLLSTSEAYLREIVEATRRPGRFASLAEDTVYRSVRSRVAASATDSLRVFVNLESIFKSLRSAVAPAVWSSFQVNGFDRLSALGVAVARDGKGLRERFYLHAPGPRAGVLGLFEAEERRGIETAKLAPASTVIYSNANVRFSKLYDTMVDIVRKDTPSAFERFETWRKPLEEKTGFRIREDLVPTVGAETAFVCSIEARGAIFPDAAYLIELEEPERFRTIFDAMVAQLPGAFIRKESYRGRTITYVRMRSRMGRNMASTAIANLYRAMFVPHYTIEDGHLVIGFFGQSVKNMLIRHDAGSTLASRHDFEHAVKRHGNTPPGSLLFVDLPRTFQFGYNAALPYMHAALQRKAMREGGMSPKALVNWASLLPGHDSITRHLFPTTLAMRSDADGIYMDSFSPVSSAQIFGAAMFGRMMTAPAPAPVVARSPQPSSFEEAYTMGRLAALEHRPEDAIRLFDHALTLAEDRPHRGQVHYMRGMVYRDQGKNDDAIRDFEAAIELKHSLRHSNYFLATVLARRGEDLRAIEKFKIALDLGWGGRLDPDLAKLRKHEEFRKLFR